MSELANQIQQNTQQPRQAESDGERAEQFPLVDQIAADFHVSEQAVAGRPKLAIRFGVMRPPSAV
jgi:hypothetical protein